MADVNQLADFDYFFYYDANPANINDEIASELYQNLLQPKRSLFYSRTQNAAGINDYENTPNAISLQVLLPYDIINSLSKRNFVVSNGQDGTLDRRVAVSQNSVRVESTNEEVDVAVFYIQLNSLQQQNISLPLGGIK